MKEKNICLSAKTVDIAEHDSYLELVSCLCYYDDENLNGVRLPYKGCEEQAKMASESLVSMPVQARYISNKNGDDLGSHEAYIDEDGNMQFNTQSIGTHTEVWIEDSEVTTVKGETKTLPCLFAKARIWTRYPNIVAVVKKLFESEGGLNSSWEIATKKYSYADGIKTLTDYEFLGNTLLGSTVTPAYKGTSNAISVSQAELMIAEALSQDLSSVEDTNSNKEETELEDIIVNVSSDENAEVVTPEIEQAEENPSEVTEAESTQVEPEVSESEPEKDEDKDEDEEEVETSSLTTSDLHRKLHDACRAKIGGWGYISMIFPEEHYVLYKKDEASDLEFVKVPYTVNGDEVEVGEPENVTLTVSMSAINETVAEFEKSIAEKDEIIVNVSAELKELKSTIAELSQYKEKFEQAEQERIAQELADKKEELIASVVKSGQITREEIAESEELSGYVDNLDKKSLMALVGERLLSSVAEKPEVETSSVVDVPDLASVNLDANDDDAETINAASIMRSFIGK